MVRDRCGAAVARVGGARTWWAVLGMLMASATPEAVRAWGPAGHAVVADAAQRELTPASAREIAQLLGPEVPLARVANFADEYRNRCANTGPWHYVNLPLDAAGYDVERDCPASRGGCVLSVLEREIAILRDRGQSDTDRAFALRLIVHFIGDLHQPLHSANRGDRGGNDVAVWFAGRKTNLHRLWDDQLMQAKRRSRAHNRSAVIRVAQEAARVAMKRGTVIEWALEAREVARRVVYGKLPPPRGGRVAIDDAYVEAAITTVDLQLERAGVRLAAVLNDAFARPGPSQDAEVIAQHNLCEGRRQRPKRTRASGPRASTPETASPEQGEGARIESPPP